MKLHLVSLLLLFVLLVSALPVPDHRRVSAALPILKASPPNPLSAVPIDKPNARVDHTSSHLLYKRQTGGHAAAGTTIGLVEIFKDPKVQEDTKKFFNKIGEDFRKSNDKMVEKWKKRQPLHPGH
ncbi:hypothetical protein M408DRAFT_13094 [Serendipita vermifera MAFF 305830]|uniref:Uncharacterized protein n=1 Tax=Serendipita vermifera MAFF 305830 TaxID=933852 RepID=A0A0C3A6K8_SERVB|nr:hypothetical protein M408DRAFT_13094 [Serendipita vermifera MAFF 305830]